MKSRPSYQLLGGGFVAAMMACLLYWFVTIQPVPFSELKVPPGFEIERVAAHPLTDRPMIADFDEEGRLYVADSSGSNDKVEAQLEEKPHRIVRLEDTDGDGRFDKSMVFADRMMLPEGAMWYDGSLYVAAPPSIWRLTDTNGDGVADQREEWFEGETLTGCANDLHGPYLGLDGWIYWTKGAFAPQSYDRPGRTPFETRAAHIFRRRPGQSLVEPVLTGGMDNPIEVVFTPEGERILTSTFLHQPAAGLRDGLIHAIYGGVYGKVHNVIDGHKRTGELMPVLTHQGPSVPCGLTRYASSVFGQDYQGNWFACLFNLHKVSRHLIEPSGATFKLTDLDFVVSSNLDFHPTDVLEDADGSLLVIDTGAWYKICCPTSQLAKPDLLGAIYRIRRRGAPKVADPRGLQLGWSGMKPHELARYLDDPRPAVRSRAIHALAKHSSESLPALADTLSAGSVEARRNAVWALTRIEDAQARSMMRVALSDSDNSVRHAAAHSASAWRDTGAFEPLTDLLKQSSPALKRVAAEALGRLGDRRAVPQILATAGESHDRVLEHSLTYALIEIADPALTAAGLQATSPYTRRATLIALDQMDGGGLKPEQVTPLLSSSDAILKQTAAWIVSRHSEWGGVLAGFFRQRLMDRELNGSRRDELQHQLTQFAGNPAIQQLLADSLRGPSSTEARLTALRAMAKAAAKEMPAAWAAGLADALAATEPEIRSEAVATARALPVPKESSPALSAALVRVARDRQAPTPIRLEALAAISGGLSLVDDSDLFTLLCQSLAPSQPVTNRGNASTVLSKAKLSASQLNVLVESVKSAGPLELNTLLSAFANTSDPHLGLRLAAALGQSKGLLSLRPDLLDQVLSKFPATVRKEGEKLLASLNVDTARQKRHLDELEVTLKGGDIRRGQTVFNSTKAACSACHAIGYLGGKAGPDLTKIGQIRGERDLLESIIYPSASFVRSYEPVVVVTRAGDVHNGVIREDSSNEILLSTGPRNEVRVLRSEIREMRPGTVSVMPSGLQQQLSRQELADLLAFLKATKWGVR